MDSGRDRAEYSGGGKRAGNDGRRQPTSGSAAPSAHQRVQIEPFVTVGGAKWMIPGADESCVPAAPPVDPDPDVLARLFINAAAMIRFGSASIAGPLEAPQGGCRAGGGGGDAQNQPVPG